MGVCLWRYCMPLATSSIIFFFILNVNSTLLAVGGSADKGYRLAARQNVLHVNVEKNEKNGGKGSRRVRGRWPTEKIG